MEQNMAGDYTCQVEEIAQLPATKPPQPHNCLYGSKRQQLRPIVLEVVMYRKNSINLQNRRRSKTNFLCFFWLGSLCLPALHYQPSHRFPFSEAALGWVAEIHVGCKESTEHITLGVVTFLKHHLFRGDRHHENRKRGGGWHVGFGVC